LVAFIGLHTERSGSAAAGSAVRCHRLLSIPDLRQNITATTRRGDQSGFVGECLEVAVVTQDATIDETIENLRGAVALQCEGENPADFGLRERPALLVTIEVQPSYARAS
jgi:hypothetical protein